MGCECLKSKKIEKEIINPNIHEKNKFLKSKKFEKQRNTDTYLNSMKTSDKNIEIIQNAIHENNIIEKNIKFDNSKYDSNIISKKITSDENINEIKKNPNTFKNKNSISNTKTKKNQEIIVINNFYKNKSKTKINQNSKKLLNSKKPIDEFSQYIFTYINKIRENPQSFIDDIEKAKFYIEYNSSNKLIYKKNIKVALSQGLPAFEETISILKIVKPMNKLIFEPKLMVKLPQNEEELLDKNFFKLEIKKMKEKGIPIKSYWRDIIKEPETSFLMMIVDDTGIKAGLKRKDILDPNMKYVGICSRNIGKYFICFVTFSDCKVN